MVGLGQIDGVRARDEFVRGEVLPLAEVFPERVQRTADLLQRSLFAQLHTDAECDNVAERVEDRPLTGDLGHEHGALGPGGPAPVGQLAQSRAGKSRGEFGFVRHRVPPSVFRPHRYRPERTPFSWRPPSAETEGPIQGEPGTPNARMPHRPLPRESPHAGTRPWHFRPLTGGARMRRVTSRAWGHQHPVQVRTPTRRHGGG